MPKNSILGRHRLNPCLLFVFVLLHFRGECDGQNSGPYSSFTVSSFSYSKTQLKPYEWRYIRVDLPPWFSSMSLALESDVDLNPRTIKSVPGSSLPMICLRGGGPPLPDAYNGSLTDLANGSFGDIQGLQNAELCYPMQKNISVTLTNEQISPGVWYWGLFNGIGATRTQSKMINRGSSYSFSGNISVEGCQSPTFWGRYCNQTIDLLSCVETKNMSDAKSDNQTAENVVSCRNSKGDSCHGYDETKIYSLDVVGIAEQLTILATNLRTNDTSSGNASGIILTCYARHGAIPLASLHDYSSNITEEPLIINSPKVGRWYITIHFVNLSSEMEGASDMNRKICYSLNWQVLQCPEEKAGEFCTWERYVLQTVLRRNPSAPFESYYLPIRGRVSSDSADFPLEPLLSNSTHDRKLDYSWTYFLLDIPYGASGGNLHIRLKSDVRINYEIYAKHGGLPSLHSWDYFYANKTSSSNGSTFFNLYVLADDMISFYILYVRGGTWSFGLRQLKRGDGASKNQTTMSVSLERCPRRCSSHGKCQSVVDASGLSLYSYCACDRNHGGFDCGVEIVSHQGHIWQSISLIASNAAAVLPAYWSLHKKAFAEWVLFTCSGISSGIYHACDVGTWCPLSFHVLQFMDFWLSFMAVVSTFIYLADIGEVSKRTIHTVVAIVTALMAETGPTRSRNIVIVLAIGGLGLFIGWLIEFSMKYWSLSLSAEFYLNILDRWQGIKVWLRNLVKMIIKRFRWGFLLLAVLALAMAAVSWTLESNASYWVWHSVWHVSIYTSSFLFLCSKANRVNGENERPSDGNYELTGQDSSARAE
ncbi:hypothetical protein NMG60_11029025 [Bertholletia excelsa]